jgi:hypothetical protein
MNLCDSMVERPDIRSGQKRAIHVCCLSNLGNCSITQMQMILFLVLFHAEKQHNFWIAFYAGTGVISHGKNFHMRDETARNASSSSHESNLCCLHLLSRILFSNPIFKDNCIRWWECNALLSSSNWCNTLTVEIAFGSKMKKPFKLFKDWRRILRH